MNVFDLVATLTLDSSEYDSGLNESEEKAEGFGSKLKGALGTAGKIGAGALTAVTTAGVAAAGAFVAGTKQVAEYGDNIDKQSQKLGISAEAYQEWDAILQHSGTSAGALTGAMKTMVKATESNTEAFAQLGISEEQIATMSKEELFSSVITGLQGMGEGLERDKLATELLGRGAVEMGALLNTSAEDTEAMRQRVHELGGVMSDEAVKSAAAFQDSLQDMKTSIQGLGRNVLVEFLPTITKVMDGIAKIFTGDKGGAKIISDGIADLIKKIKDALPRMIETGTELMDSLLDVIIDNLPSLIEAGTEIIVRLATGILKALPKLLQKAPEIIKALLGALKQNAPQLLQAALEFIQVLGRGIVDNLPKLLEGAKKMITTLGDGLIKFIDILLQKAPTIVSKLVTAIIQYAPKLLQAATELVAKLAVYIIKNLPQIIQAAVQIVGALLKGIAGAYEQLFQMGKNVIICIWNGIATLNPFQWGADLMSNFISGIFSKFRALADAARNAAGTVWSYLHFSEPEKGPLSDFHTYAPDMMKLFAQGIEDNERLISDQLNKSLNFGLDVNARSLASSPANGGNITINVYGAEGQSVNALAEIVMERLTHITDRDRRAFA